MAGSIPAVFGGQGWPNPLWPLLCCRRSSIRTPAAESGEPEEAGVIPARSRHCDRGSPSRGSQELLSLSSCPGRGPRGRGSALLLLLSTSDTDLMSARSSNATVGWRYANPSRLDRDGLPALVDGTDLVVVRLLGGRRAWPEGLDALLAGPRPVVVLTGEQAPDAELMELSTVPAGVCAETHASLAQGGSANLVELFNFLSDTILLTG